MHRTPPRRQPRVAVFVAFQGGRAFLVRDPWDVRVAMVRPSRRQLLRSIAAERPGVLLCAPSVPRELLNAGARPTRLPDTSARLEACAELRRFRPGRHTNALANALQLADDFLATYAHNMLSKN